MFFIVSKLLYFVLQPFNWIIVFLLVGFWFKKRKYSIIAIILLIFFTNPLVINGTLSLWEPAPTLLKADECYEYGIVLGGYSNFSVKEQNHFPFTASGNRLWTAIELFKTNKIRKIVLSGGSGNLLGNKENESVRAFDYLIRIGIPDSCIIIENASRNTNENASYSKKILSNFPEGKSLLITSAFHMRRAKACFQKAGLTITPYPTEYWAEQFYWTPTCILIPDNEAIKHWEAILKEWVGFLIYKIQGYV